MMIVNASFDPGLFYDETIDNLCENTTFEFSADIINLIRRGVNDHSDPNVDFLIDGTKLAGTGNIPKNERWNTYSFTFETAPGQTSVRLSLRNNAPGGIGNDLALDNITFRACGPPSEIRNPELVGGIHCQEEGPLSLIATIEGVEDATRSYLWEISHEGPSNWMLIADENTSRISLEFDEAEEVWIRFAAAGSPLNLENENCRFYSESLFIKIPQREYEVNDTLCGGLPLPFDEGGLVRPGLFVQNLIGSHGCDSIRMIQLDTIQRATLIAELILVDPTCPEQPSGIIEGQNVSGGYLPYHIQVDDIPYEELVANGLSAGQHRIFIKDKFECFYETEAVLSEPPPFSITLGGDRNITLGEEIDIEAISTLPLSTIDWSSNISGDPQSSEFTILPIENTTISVIGSTTDGCIARDSIDIIVNIEANIYTPNAFSPNGDGKNDEYYISAFGKSLDRIEAFEIYDRWGNLVFDNQTNSSDIWDGTFKNSELQSNTYAFRLVAILINGDVIKRSGAIQIIK